MEAPRRKLQHHLQDARKPGIFSARNYNHNSMLQEPALRMTGDCWCGIGGYVPGAEARICGGGECPD